MTFNECKFCFCLFCTYYDGKTVKDIPNMEGISSEIKIDASKMMITKNKYNISFYSSFSLFWFEKDKPNTFKLDYLISYEGERKYYSSVEDFLNYFKIPFKDIV